MAKKTVVEEGKALLKSKTFWFNVLWVIVTIAGLFGFNDFQPDSNLVETWATIGAVVNIILRTYTKEPIIKIK